MSYTFILRNGTSAEWAASSRILLKGEPGIDTDLNIHKLGDGVSLWAALPAVGMSAAEVAATVALTTVPATMLKPLATPPSGFRGLTVLPTPTIRRKVGAFTATLDLEALRPAAGVTYYTAPGAGTGATGLTAGTPVRLNTALAKSDIGTLVVAAGEYTREETAVTSAITKNLNWIGTVDGSGNRPKITGFNRVIDTAWTSTSGHIYQTTRSATNSVVDVTNKTSWGDYTVYEKKADLASITAAGQWAIVGTTVYVWAIGNTNLSSGENRTQIRLQIDGKHGIHASASTHYVQDIDFLGCGAGTSGDTYLGGLIALTGAKIIAKNCAVRYNASIDGPSTRDGGHMISVGVEVSSNGKDGFNYHDVAGGNGEFIEIGCWSHHNGLPSPGSNNATTAHEAVTGIRVNGLYEQAAGPVVADVNSAHTWNVGCQAGGQGVTVSSSQRQSWRTDGASPVSGKGLATMWLDECTADTSQYAFGATTGALIKLHAVGAANASTLYTGSTPLALFTR